MKDISSSPKSIERSHFVTLLAVLAFSAALLRAWPLIHWGGWQVPVDYDEGVYSSAAQLLFKGVLPFRDFVFVHPPGLLYFLGTTALLPRLDPSQIFVASRFIAVLVGGANVWLVGQLACKWRGPIAGLIAAALYATYPEVVTVERGPFLEPVLNLVCLGSAVIWLRLPSRASTWLTGALLGCAVAVKLTGGVFVLGAAAAIPRHHLKRLGVPLIAATCLSATALIAPMALFSPNKFFDEVLLFHARRPPDGLADRAVRLQEMLWGLHPVAGALGLAGMLMALLAFSRERPARLICVAFLAAMLSSLVSSTYWNQYNAFLAPSQTVLAGIAGAALWDWAERRGRIAGWAGGCLIVISAFPSLRRAILRGRAHDPSLVRFSSYARHEIPNQDCVFAFEPAWTLAAGRLPFYHLGQPPVIDGYAAMLISADPLKRPFPDTRAAFETSGALAPLSQLFQQCPYFILGERGRFQLGVTGSALIESRFHRVESTRRTGVDLWVARRP